jgi:phosphate acetyltransferase
MKRLIKKEKQRKIGEVLDLIIDKYKRLEEQFDFVLLREPALAVKGLLIELSTNVLIAKNLGFQR